MANTLLAAVRAARARDKNALGHSRLTFRKDEEDGDENDEDWDDDWDDDDEDDDD